MRRPAVLDAPWRRRSTDSVTVGAVSGASALRLGYTMNQSQTNATMPSGGAARSMIDRVAVDWNQHSHNTGAVSPSNGAATTGGAPTTAAAVAQPSGPPWFNAQASLDLRVGEPGDTAGWMFSADTRTISFRSSPVWMRHRVGSNPQAAWAPSGPSTSSSADKPPHPDHFDHYAELCAEIAARYTHVDRFMVGVELQGWYISAENRWGMWSGYNGNTDETLYGYTDLYNRVCAAVKTARPDALVGGPYNVINSQAWRETAYHATAVKVAAQIPTRFGATPGFPALEGDWGWGNTQDLDALVHWLRYADDADFIVLDMRNNTKDYEASDWYPIGSAAYGGTSDKWRGTPPAAPTGTGAYYSEPYYFHDDPWASAAKFTAVHEWIAAAIEVVIDEDGTRTWLRDLPIVYAEWYANGPVNAKTAIGATDTLSTTWSASPDGTVDFSATPTSTWDEMQSVLVWQMIETIEAGTETLYMWKPQGDVSGRANSGLPGGGANLALYDSGIVATDLYRVLGYVRDHFPAGTALHAVTSSNADVRALASATHVLVVSKSAAPLSVRVDGTDVVLAPYDVQLVAR